LEDIKQLPKTKHDPVLLSGIVEITMPEMTRRRKPKADKAK
jgi:hypothetical protein